MKKVNQEVGIPYFYFYPLFSNNPLDLYPTYSILFLVPAIRSNTFTSYIVRTPYKQKRQ